MTFGGAIDCAQGTKALQAFLQFMKTRPGVGDLLFTRQLRRFPFVDSVGITVVCKTSFSKVRIRHD